MANRNTQKFGIDAVRRRLTGVGDSNSTVDILSRGKTVYGNGSSAAHRGGGPQFGRPRGSRDKIPAKSAINRRIAARRRMLNG